MAQQNQGFPQDEFHGVYLSGNPLRRPRGSASKCENFRVMPGFWLRAFGGRKGRYNFAKTIQQIHPYRILALPGADTQLVQYKNTSSDIQWTWLSILTYGPDPFNLEQISLLYDGGYAANNPVAVCNTYDRPVYYNGLGVRDSTSSKPPFSSSFNGVTSYWGLDCYCPAGNPTVAFTAGSGYNQVLTAVRIWVGVYNSNTEHYSNAVYCGEITTTGATGTITVSNLARIKPHWHSVSEQAQLSFVFYATVDESGRVPYLILNSAMNGPYTAAITATSADLSIVASGTTNGWMLNEASEAPTQNYPPRPMRTIWFANGRMYGATMPGGSGYSVPQLTFSGDFPRPDFTYVPTDRDHGGVWWSAAAGDDQGTDRLGDPLQSWPLINFAATPNGDAPICGCAIDDDKASLVLTPRAAFRLVESTDGVHVFTQISGIHGIVTKLTLAETPYGRIWVDQQKQIILLQPDDQIVILSAPYQNLITSNPVCGDYLLDPLNDIDCYRIWLSDGTCIVHDFEHRTSLMPYGEAYTATGQAYNCAKSVLDSSGRRHHIVADTAIYTQEGQPEDAQILTGIETFTTGQTKTTALATGTWIGNWDDGGDSQAAKELPQMDILADPDRVTLTWWKDLEAPDSTHEQYTERRVAPQSGANEALWRYSLHQSKAFWRKLKLVWAPPASGAPTLHPNANSQGDLGDSNFFGCIMRMILNAAQQVNRK